MMTVGKRQQQGTYYYAAADQCLAGDTLQRYSAALYLPKTPVRRRMLQRGALEGNARSSRALLQASADPVASPPPNAEQENDQPPPPLMEGLSTPPPPPPPPARAPPPKAASADPGAAFLLDQGMVLESFELLQSGSSQLLPAPRHRYAPSERYSA